MARRKVQQVIEFVVWVADDTEMDEVPSDLIEQVGEREQWKV